MTVGILFILLACMMMWLANKTDELFWSFVYAIIAITDFVVALENIFG